MWLKAVIRRLSALKHNVTNQLDGALNARRSALCACKPILVVKLHTELSRSQQLLTAMKLINCVATNQFLYYMSYQTGRFQSRDIIQATHATSMTSSWTPSTTLLPFSSFHAHRTVSCDRSFGVAGPRVWYGVRQDINYGHGHFRRLLKTLGSRHGRNRI